MVLTERRRKGDIKLLVRSINHPNMFETKYLSGYSSPIIIHCVVYIKTIWIVEDINEYVMMCIHRSLSLVIRTIDK